MHARARAGCMAAARGGTMVVRTGKRSSWRGGRGRSQARQGSGSDDTSDEDYRLGADGEEEDEVSSEDGEDEVGELEVSDDEDAEEEEGDETSSEGSELGDEDEDFVINPVTRKKRKPTPKKKVKRITKPKARKRLPAKKRRSGIVQRVCCDEDGEGMVREPKPQRRVRKRRRFGDVDDDEDGDDVDFSPEDEEEDDDFDDDELEDEGVDEEEEDDDDDLEEDESIDEEDEVFGKFSVKRKKGSRKGSAKSKRGGKRRKANSGVRKRKRSNTKGGGPKRRRNAFVSSDDDDDDEDFVIDEEEEEEEDEEDVETGEITRKPNRSGGANARRRSLALEYDSAASYSDFDDTAPDIDAGRIVGLVQRPRTACRVGSKQEPKGKQKEAEQEPPEKRICGVCLSDERNGHILGLLNSCAHFFCFTCILEWSKVESRCPVCKQRFTTITKTSGSDLAIQLRPIVVNVPERDQVYQPSEEEVRGYLDPYANVVCIECLQGGEDTLMLLCDICNSAAHTYCVGLGREVPEGDWYCDACRSADYLQPNVPGEENENQQVPNGPELQQPRQHTSNRTGRVEIDMNLPYIPSPERPPETFADESSYLRTGDLSPSAQVPLPAQEHPAGRASRSARQSASTVSERRALRLRIQNIFSNNWSNVTRFRHNPHQGEERQQPPVLFDDLNALNRDFF